MSSPSCCAAQLIAGTASTAPFSKRVMALMTLENIGHVVPADVMQARVVPAILRMSADAVPNVRFNVAKSLQRLAPRMDASFVGGHVRPVLTTLTEDADEDVRYFAAKALAAC